MLSITADFQTNTTSENPKILCVKFFEFTHFLAYLAE